MKRPSGKANKKSLYRLSLKELFVLTTEDLNLKQIYFDLAKMKSWLPFHANYYVIKGWHSQMYFNPSTTKELL